MESLYNLIKKYGTGKGEPVMWKSVRVISEAVDKNMDDKAKEDLERKIYAEMSGGHYDEEFALEDVKHMYYVDERGERHYAPYWTPEQVEGVYNSVRSEIPDYNMWDFYVVLQMQKSDLCPMLKKWFPGATDEQMTQKVVEAAVNWLVDDDNPYGQEKIWRYLNGW